MIKIHKAVVGSRYFNITNVLVPLVFVIIGTIYRFFIGGVYPEIQAKDDTLTLLTRVLGTNGIMIEFIIKNIDLFPKAGNMTVEDYIFNYNVSDELMEKLKVFSHDEKHIWNDEMYAKDKELIRNKFKSYIAHYLWGNSAFNASEAVNSKVVQQSLINMQKAVDILK